MQRYKKNKIKSNKAANFFFTVRSFAVRFRRINFGNQRKLAILTFLMPKNTQFSGENSMFRSENSMFRGENDRFFGRNWHFLC